MSHTHQKGQSHIPIIIIIIVHTYFTPSGLLYSNGLKRRKKIDDEMFDMDDDNMTSGSDGFIDLKRLSELENEGEDVSHFFPQISDSTLVSSPPPTKPTYHFL